MRDDDNHLTITTLMVFVAISVALWALIIGLYLWLT